VKTCYSCGSERVEEKSGTYRFDLPPNIPGGTVVIADAAWRECDNCGWQLLTAELSHKIEELVMIRQGRQGSAGDFEGANAPTGKERQMAAETYEQRTVRETNELFHLWGGNYENAEMLTADGNKWRVKSSDGVTVYSVLFVCRASDDVGLWECNCPAGRNGKTCKHIDLVGDILSRL
jgi:hypothetical protein